MQCFICEKENLFKFLSLGNQPPSNAFLKEKALNNPEVYYPLDLYYCGDCGLVQLGYVVDPKILFEDYIYNTGSNNSLIKNFQELVDTLVKRFSIKGAEKNDLAVDIGSNDGTLLKGYLKYDIKILGVEPSNIAEIAIKNNVPTLKKFFNEDTALKIIKEYGNAKFITATNVFAHVNDLKSFMHGVKELLSDDGIFVQESHYLLSLLKDMQWDSIYHEHLRYYSLRPLIYLFKHFGMELFDAERITTHGGSIRTYACKKGTYPITENVNRLLKEEESNGLFDKNTYLNFGKKVLMHKFKIQEMLRYIKEDNKRVIGIGAPAKGNTLLNYCNITPDIIDYIVEKSKLKVGMYTPGTHIKVVDESLMLKDQPDFALLLSWNIANELIPKIKDNGYKGKIIVPLPSPHIVG